MSAEKSALLDAARGWHALDPDPVTRQELESLMRAEDVEALRDRFAQRLEFGTAGLRGLLGAGPGRMNRALVRRVTRGLGAYLLETLPDVRERGVAVGHDARRLSPEFAEDTARVLGEMGIAVHFFEDYAPTPLLAFAVRDLAAAAGVVVTASHNPPEYNGYKVYWENAAQIIPPHDRGISAAIDAVDPRAVRELPEMDELRRRGVVRPVEAALRERYHRELLELRRHPGVATDRITVVYSPMHGVGGRDVVEVLGRAGFTRVHPVPEQFEPDGEFPTVRFPNPEEDGAMDLALAQAKQCGADLVLANDPDADRLAVAIPTDPKKENYRLLSGNEIGCLLATYLLEENLRVDGEPLVMTTIVSSRQLQRIANEHGAHYDETLTGFKWIANASQRHRAEKGWRLVLGYEEALGYTVGEVVADKDGIGAALLFAELAAVCRDRGQSVDDYLDRMARRSGLYLSHQHSVVLPGLEGRATIEATMAAFRTESPTRVGDRAVLELIDYAPGHAGLPPSNVLALHLEGGARILLRPSGTEPKIKYYFEVATDVGSDESVDDARARLRVRLDALVADFLPLAEERARA